MRVRIFCVVLLALSTTLASAQQFDLVLEGGRVMDPETGVDSKRNVGVRDGSRGGFGTIAAVVHTALLDPSHIEPCTINPFT